ncbi:pyruvate kinase [Patescibacteria group bacterium]|nr:pyruvate kinase [Patescibacteria group bacterium]MBU4452858.1 pyruvate kinase [Patescibacteria group bacterium]
MKRRTKIIATIGPASSSAQTLCRMMRAGMDVARLNFSHGSYADHKILLKHIRSSAKKEGKCVAILQDLQGPKIRIGELPKEGIAVEKGQRVKLCSGQHEYKGDGVLPVVYDKLHKDIKKGHRLFIDDGFIETIVESVRGRIINVKVVYGGIVKAQKGINIPDSTVSSPALTKKDKEDLLFGLEMGVDYVALSFVTSANDVRILRKIINSECLDLSRVPAKIIAKIERAEAIEKFSEILEVSDGIMIARGDLGVEIKPEQVPIMQKEMVELCRQAGKPVIIATHMMESMTKNPRATRAETSDVANAVIDHTDAVMLSAETATGEFPYASVRAMAMIIDEAEASRFDDISFYQLHDIDAVQTSIAQSVHIMAQNKQIDLIATSSSYPAVASTVNIFRPNVPIIIACPNDQVARQMVLRAGVDPIVMSEANGTFILRIQRYLAKNKLIKKNSHVAYVTASPAGEVQLIVK